ncbi:hypothetical protein ACFRMQ_21250 [Kitasatospora sp. NPDC056783]|uniref:hypothetical protein n=1 Tax=Kitasatospora sp. NPDC056783 TaxID=3345943 RepID=UPI003685CF52
MSATTEPIAAPNRTHSWELWVLLVWHGPLGAPVDPVAVLALNRAPNAPTPSYLTWVPLTYDAAAPWRERLDGSVTPEQVERWSHEDSACAAVAAEVPDDAVDLAHAAEIVLDGLLAEAIPAIAAAGRR